MEGVADARARDYDVEHHARVLRSTLAARLARMLSPGDFAALFADPDQLLLFEPAPTAMRILLRQESAAMASAGSAVPSGGRRPAPCAARR